MSKQIEEVMALVDSYVKASIEYDIHLDDVPLYDESMDLAREQLDKKRSTIEAKLRELLRNHEANKEALDEYFKKTDWVNGTFQSHELGHHRADVLRMRIEKLQKQVQK